TRKTLVNQPAILIRLLVQITNRGHAEVRESVTEFFEVLLAQNLRLLAIRRARHGEGDSSMFAICSPTTALRNHCLAPLRSLLAKSVRLAKRQNGSRRSSRRRRSPRTRFQRWACGCLRDHGQDLRLGL